MLVLLSSRSSQELTVEMLDERRPRVHVALAQLLDRPLEARPRFHVEAFEECDDRAAAIVLGVEHDRPIILPIHYAHLIILGRLRQKFRERFGVSDDETRELLYVLETRARRDPLPIRVRDLKEEQMLAAALGAGVGYRVSGDDALLTLPEPAPRRVAHRHRPRLCNQGYAG